jgi:hypothetical protein
MDQATIDSRIDAIIKRCKARTTATVEAPTPVTPTVEVYHDEVVQEETVTPVPATPVGPPLGREPRALEPWSDAERRGFERYAISIGRTLMTMTDADSVDWLRRERGLQPIPRPAKKPMVWHHGEYGEKASTVMFNWPDDKPKLGNTGPSRTFGR